MHRDRSATFGMIQAGAYYVFLMGQLALIFGIVLFNPNGLIVWLMTAIPWASPQLATPPGMIVGWIPAFGTVIVGLFLGGQVISIAASLFELGRMRRNPTLAGPTTTEPPPRLDPSAQRSLRYIRNWLVLDGVVVYGTGLIGFNWTCLQCAADQWYFTSLFFYTGIFLFSLAIVPALILWFDGFRVRPRKQGRHPQDRARGPRWGARRLKLPWGCA